MRSWSHVRGGVWAVNARAGASGPNLAAPERGLVTALGPPRYSVRCNGDRQAPQTAWSRPLPPTAHWLLGFMWLNKTPKSSAQLNPFVSATGSSDAVAERSPPSAESRPAAAAAAHLRLRRPPRPPRPPPPRTRGPGSLCSTNSASSAAAAILACAAKRVLLDGWDPA